MHAATWTVNMLFQVALQEIPECRNWVCSYHLSLCPLSRVLSMWGGGGGGGVSHPNTPPHTNFDQLIILLDFLKVLPIFNT